MKRIANLNATQAVVNSVGQATFFLVRWCNDVVSALMPIGLLGSYADPNAVLTATDTAISIAAHTRRYADGSSADLAAGSITDLTPATRYFVTYVDPTYSGGSLAYLASTDMTPERGSTHSLGWIMTAATGDPDTTGHTAPPPGIPPLG